MRATLLCLTLLTASATQSSGEALRIFFIDVGGGQATLLVAPSGRSMLIDAGYPGFEGRDATRIADTAKRAGVSRLDVLLVTHHHRDHVGGVLGPGMAARRPRQPERLEMGWEYALEASRDRMHTREARRAEFAQLQKWGVKGVKVDFWHSDKPNRIQQYLDVMQDAADFQIAVNFHGSTIPRGWSREFPHLMSMEAVFGAEQYKFRQAFTTRAAWLNTVLPFTRNVIGAMDYTPVTFTDVRYPRTPTNAHELAQSVVFESGIQHFADSVESYRALPDAAKQFLKQVAAAWDETRGIAGEPGEFVVIARRDGETWYVGGLNADAAVTAKVPLAFLGAGSWSMTLIGDGAADREFKDSTRSVTSTEVVEVPMRARGGFVMRITKTPTSAKDNR